MVDEKKDPKTMLTEAIKKRDELNTFIKVLQEMLGMTDAVQAELVPGAPKPSEPGAGSDFDPLSTVYPGMFFGKSQTQAVKLLLEQVRPRPMKTKAIVPCLEKGGMKVGGKKPLVNLWGVLSRDKETFILVPKAGWGLVEWYDPAVIAKYRKEAKENGEEGDERNEDKKE